MLVLTRKVGEGIAIGDDIKIVVMQIKGKQVRLGIKANANTVVHREEVYQRILDENKSAAQAEVNSLDKVATMLNDTDRTPKQTPFKRVSRPARKPDPEED